MGELACNMVYVYLSGAWSWLTRATAARKRLSYRECTLELGHACSHTPAYPPTMSPSDPLPTYAELDRLRLEPDPERDRRREAYRALEREQARRALDAWFQAVDAGEVIGDGAREVAWREFMESTDRYRVQGLHHKGNYGVPADDWPLPAHEIAEAARLGVTVDPADMHHNGDHGASTHVHDVNGCIGGCAVAQMSAWLRRRGVGLTPTPGTVRRGVDLDHAEALRDHDAPDAAHDERARQRDRERAGGQ